MSLKDALIAGLDTVPGCETICYVDMASGLVLASHCYTRRPQEFYDKIASFATKLMQSPSLVGPSGKIEADEKCIFVLGHNRTHVFVKAMTFPEHAICYMCANSDDTDALSAAVTLNRETIANAM
jgi:hypothetical protein